MPDLSISRPVERLTWGVRVPGDDSQTIYVWLDALINYLTKAGYPFPPGQEGRKGWPADVHVIGKDISRLVRNRGDRSSRISNSTDFSFHCVYWPAFLMALDIPLPRQILTHAHWTMNHEKMSKSTGNVVNPMFALERFGIDTMRFFLAHHGGLAYDADYDNSYIIEKYKKNLQWGMGNLSSRLLRSKKWVIRDSIEWFAHGKLPDENEADKEHRLLLESLADKVKGNMDKLSARDALRDIQEVIIAVWNDDSLVTSCALLTCELLAPDPNRQINIYRKQVHGIFPRAVNETLRSLQIVFSSWLPNLSAFRQFFSNHVCQRRRRSSSTCSVLKTRTGNEISRRRDTGPIWITGPPRST